MRISAIRLRWLYLHGSFLWMGLLFAFVGMALIALGLWIWGWEQGFQSRAIRTVATVTGKEKGRVPKGKNSSEIAFFLVYTFRDDAGRQQQGKMGASFEDWRRAKRGDMLEIEYDSTSPATSRRAGTEAHAEWGLLILGGIGGLFTLFGISLTSIAALASGQRTRLVRFGTPALGVVDEVIENESPLKVAGTYRLTYRFTDGNGQTWEGRGPPQPWSLAGRWDPGETILVLYDPRNPRRNEPDIWEARMEDLATLQDQMGDQ
jgi:hypothetical protein